MSRRTSYDDRTQHLIYCKNADETEIQALKEGFAHIEAGIHDEIIADALDDFGPDLPADPDDFGMERFNAMDLAIEGAAGTTFEEISWRQELLGTLYPFRVNGNTIEYTGSSNGIYELALSISLNPISKAASLFEEIASVAAQAILGKGTISWHTGWPRSGGKPVRIKELYSLINNETSEFNWSPKQGLPTDPSHTDEKDCGIDIIAQKKLDPYRPANIFLFGQCACGDNWVEKLHECDPKYRLEQYFETTTLVPPVKAIFVPFCLSQYWINIASKRGDILAVDRLRLVRLSHEINQTVWEDRFSKDQNIREALTLAPSN